MDPLLITADRLFDGTAIWLRPLVEVTGGQVTAVRARSATAAPPPAKEFPGCTILPGLIDTHVHLVFSALETNEAIVEQVGRESDDELLARALANAKAALSAGLTTVRDCGGRGRVVQQVRDRIRYGQAVGPD